MSRSCRFFLVAILTVGIPGCQVATEPKSNMLSHRVESNLAPSCYAVRATWTASPSGPTTFTGSLTGDLEGTMTSDFDPNSLKFAGSTLAVSFTNFWTITGGVLPASVSFVTASEGLNHLMDRPGSPATLFESTGRHRAISGVAKANLTGTNTVDFSLALPVLVGALSGVICP
jgi:hypothetical protein